MIKGRESLFYIKYNSIWFPVACLTSSPLSEEAEMIDTTTRDSGGWKTSYPTLQSYSIELAGLVNKDDEDSGNEIISYQKLTSFKRNRVLIDWKIETEQGYYVDSGQGFIRAISKNDEVEEMISFNASLVGYGKLEESTLKTYVLGDSSNNIVFGEDNNIIETR